MSQTMELVMDVGIGLLFVVTGIALLVSIIFAVKPYDQITFATAETLRSALNEACFYGKPIELQNVALPETGMTFLHQAMLSIIQKGDPSYLIYYEQFPVGEAISWETYLNGKMNDRIFTQMSGQSFTTEQAAAFRSTITAPGGAAVDVIINNVKLATGLNMLTLEPPKDKKSPVTGEWKNDEYYLLNYQPDALGKTSAKYMSCGDGNLCVKTKSGIYAYPLKECKGVIDYIQLINNNLKSLADSKHSDFYLNSPCKADVTVNVEDCHCKLATYSVYEYDDKSKTFTSTVDKHNSCIDGIGNAPGIPEKSFKCAVVKINKRDGCYTTSPLLTAPLKLSGYTGPHPVDVYSTWLSENTVLLTTKDIVSIANEFKTKLLNIVANVWYWPWSS
ncbi:MAG: hypothetical protein HY365_01230 [Candidatus Aenigmarchaeota archaeon]|nr:hypothetical protein [Candidatus Aenigmarchaeota archaeon]